MVLVKMRSPWIKGGPNLMTVVLIRRPADTETGGDGGRGGGDAATSRGTTDSGRQRRLRTRRERTVPQSLQRERHPDDTVLADWLLSCERGHLCCLKPPVMVATGNR